MNYIKFGILILILLIFILYPKNNVCNKPIINYFNNNGKINVLFVGGTHGNEPAGYLALKDYNFNNIPNINFTVVTMNPYGLEKNTRENTREKGCV